MRLGRQTALANNIDVRSLAAFKRFLATPGATVTVTRHDWVDNPPPNSSWAKPETREKITAPRQVAKLQTNAVKWSNGGWTYFDKSMNGRGADGFRFEGDTVTMDLSRDASWSAVCVYSLSIGEANWPDRPDSVKIKEFRANARLDRARART